MANKKIEEYEIIDHGFMYSDYFQGCGTSFTPFTDVATGIGMSPLQAQCDAMNNLQCNGWDTSIIKEELNDDVPDELIKSETGDYWHYVSIRVR